MDPSTVPTTPPVEEEDEWGKVWIFNFYFLRILSLTLCLVAEKMWEKRESFDFVFVFVFGVFSICVNIFGHNCLMMLLCCAYELLYLIWVFWFHYAFFFFLQWHCIGCVNCMLVAVQGL